MKKDIFITIRSTAEQKTQWKSYADRLGISLTSFINIAIAQYVCEYNNLVSGRKGYQIEEDRK